MAKNKNTEKEHIETQKITAKGGYAQNVYYTRQMAIDSYRMIYDSIEHMKSNQWANRPKDASVKFYLEAIDDKLVQLDRIINFSENKSNFKAK